MTLKALAAFGLIAAITAGCASTTGAADDNPPSGSNADKSAAATTKAATKKPAPKAPTFGQAFTWKDGLSVKVSRPKTFEPGEYAAGAKGGTAVRFTFTVVNNTDKPYDPSLFYATLQSGNAESEQIFDSENDLEGSPQTKLLPKREAKFDLGFSAKNPKDLVLEVSPDAGIEYQSALFTN